MAKATKVIQRIEITPEEQERRDRAEIDKALVENKDAIIASLKIAGQLKERGILDMLSALLSQGDKVLDILVKTADTPETSNMLKNLLLLGGTLGVLNVSQLEPFILKINSGIARVAEHKDSEERTSYFEAAKSLRDPEINRAVTLLLTFLKGMGEDTKSMERNTQTPHDQVQEIREK